MMPLNSNIATREFEDIWSIKILRSKSPLDIYDSSAVELASITKDDVTDIPAAFVADPFMISDQQQWYLFMEILNAETDLGEIGLAQSTDGLSWTYQQVVLKEPFHLSYPLVMHYEGAYYMIPETLEANAVRLYKATQFPWQWEFERTLLEGRFADPTVFEYGGKWWMFAYTFRAGDLHLFYADSFKGPYTEHSKSPVVSNDIRTSRPAGKLINYKSKLYRVCQDGYPKYGSSVRVFEITQLTEMAYEEIEIPQSPILKPSLNKHQWNSSGMHHIDAHELSEDNWLSCIDGCYLDQYQRP